MFTYDGAEASSLDDLKDGGFYIAVDRMPLKVLPFDLVNGCAAAAAAAVA
jgi:hypothetical protein